jgi:hypothetical protein
METLSRVTIRLDDEPFARGVARFKVLGDRTRLGILALMIARDKPGGSARVRPLFLALLY